MTTTTDTDTTLATDWRAALCDVKGTHLTAGAAAATKLAVKYLELKTITTGDYIALVRWSEGRPSYAARPYAA